MNQSAASARPAAWVCACVACLATAIALTYALQQPGGSAIIAGVVIDENHVPVPRVRVLVFPAKDALGASAGVQGLIRNSGSTSTDATGRFRISGLAEGDYVVAAEALPVFPNDGQLRARVWAPTFSPSSTDLSGATPVFASQTSAPVTIELVPVTPVRVKGTVTTESGRSAEGFDLVLFHSFAGFGSGAPVAVVGAKGAFEIPRVPPGVYELTIEPHGSQPGDEGREFVDQMLGVGDHDVSLSLTAGPGASLTGHVVAEPAGVLTTPIGLRVTAAPSSAHGQPAPGRSIASPVKGDWSFTMTGLSGLYDFSASSDRPPPAIVVTRVVLDGTSHAGSNGIALAQGHHDVVVYLASRTPPPAPVNTTATAAQLVQQFRNEKTFWKQFEIGKAVVDKHDTSVLPVLAGWLQHSDRHIRGNVAFIFASFGDPRGLETIAGILGDRGERREGQGIPGVTGDGRYHYEAQVAADRYYAAHLLGDLKDPRGVELLVPLLDDRQTQSIAPWALGQIGDKRAIQPLIAALDKDDPSMRVLAIYALEALHAKEAVPRLLTLFDDDRKSRLGALVTVSEAAKAAVAALR
jgi:hypothetical protein